jgi:hypothetical protein
MLRKAKRSRGRASRPIDGSRGSRAGHIRRAGVIGDFAQSSPPWKPLRRVHRRERRRGRREVEEGPKSIMPSKSTLGTITMTPVMEIYGNMRQHQIDVHFDLSYEKSIDIVTLIYGAQAKFSGDITDEGKYSIENKQWGIITLAFNKWDDFDSALNYIRNNTDDIGRVKDSYEGALERIDPRRLFSRSILSRIIQLKSSN